MHASDDDTSSTVTARCVEEGERDKMKVLEPSARLWTNFIFAIKHKN